MAHDNLALGNDAMPVSGVIAATAARTTAFQTDDIGNLGGDTLIVVINVTAKGAAPSVTFIIEGVVYPDGPNGTPVAWTLLASAAVVAVGVVVLEVNPSGAAVANLVANKGVPDHFRVRTTVGNADSLTYSVTAVLTV
jgi:hypothetical protein